MRDHLRSSFFAIALIMRFMANPLCEAAIAHGNRKIEANASVEGGVSKPIVAHFRAPPAPPPAAPALPAGRGTC